MKLAKRYFSSILAGKDGRIRIWTPLLIVTKKHPARGIQISTEGIYWNGNTIAKREPI